MFKSRCLKAIAVFALGTAGFITYKTGTQAAKNKNKQRQIQLTQQTAQQQTQQPTDVSSGFRISDINDKYLRQLALSIDSNGACKGKSKGVLENGKEMSIFFERFAGIIYLNNKQKEKSTQIIKQIAASANEETYNEFKSICYRNGDNGYKREKCHIILDMMNKQYDQNSYKNTEEKSNNFEIKNKYSYKEIARLYPGLTDKCGGSLNAAVAILDIYIKKDSEENANNSNIKLPEEIFGCKLDKNKLSKLT